MKFFSVNTNSYNTSGLQMAKLFPIILLTVILSLVFCPTVVEASAEFWQEQLAESRQKFEMSGSLLARYQLAVSRANKGHLWETYEMINEFEDEFDLEELEEEIAFELRLAELGSENLLYLNYAAFYYSIKENYQKSVDYFSEISKVDDNNIWPLNYKALILIEELSEYEKALDVLDEALSIEENDYSYLLRGLAYYRAGNYLRAVNNLRRGKSTLDEIEEKL